MQAMREIHARTLAIVTRAELSGDWATALRALGESRRNLELLARLDGSLGGPATPVGPLSITIEYAQKEIGPGRAMRLIEAGE